MAWLLPLDRLGLHGALLLILAVGGAGCGPSSPPRYLRLSGPAPALSRVPNSSALLVVFWASWCAPCREETPQLRALAGDPLPGMAVAVLSHDKGMKHVLEFFGGVVPPELHLQLDPGERLGRAFGVEVLPASFLVVNGQMVARFSGIRDWNSAAMRQLLRRLMKERLAEPDRHQDAAR